MSRITLKSTKPEIYAAYEALQARPTTWADAWALAATTATTVSRETVSLAQDTYKLGVWCRNGVGRIVDELSRPVLKKS